MIKSAFTGRKVLQRKFSDNIISLFVADSAVKKVFIHDKRKQLGIVSGTSRINFTATDRANYDVIFEFTVFIFTPGVKQE